MPKRFITYSRTEPARTILAIVAVLLLLGGVWNLLPWAVPTMTQSAVGLGFDIPNRIGNCFTVVFGLAGVWAVRKGTPRHIAMGSLWLFMWMLFVTWTRFIAFPLGATAFLLPLMVTLILAVIRIEQLWVVSKTEGSANE